MPEETQISAAPVAEPVSASVSTEVSTPTTIADPQQGQSSIDYLREAVAQIPIPKEELKPEAEVVKPAELIKPAEAVKTPEQIAEEAKAKPVEQKPAEAVAENPLDKLGPLPAETLAAALKAFPKLEADFAKAGISKDILFETSRRAAEADQFREIVGTPESAVFIKQGADHFFEIEEGVTSLGTPEGFNNFVNLIGRLSVVKDASGNPVKNADGTFKTDGTMENLFQGVGQRNFADMRQAAEAVSEELGQEVNLHLDRLDEIFGGVISGKPKAAAALPGDLPPDVKKELEEARASKAQNAQRDKEYRERDEKAFEEKVISTTVEGIGPQLRETLDKTAFNDKQKEKVAKEFYTAMAAHLATSKAFQAQRRNQYALGMDDANMKKLAGLNVREIKANFTTILQQVLDEYGVSILNANQAKLGKIATQIDKDRPNATVGTSINPSGSGPKTEDEFYAQAVQNIRERSGGREPTQRDIISEVLKLKHIA